MKRLHLTEQDMIYKILADRPAAAEVAVVVGPRNQAEGHIAGPVEIREHRDIVQEDRQVAQGGNTQKAAEAAARVWADIHTLAGGPADQ